jgi:hypothetical protein
VLPARQTLAKAACVATVLMRGAWVTTNKRGLYKPGRQTRKPLQRMQRDATRDFPPVRTSLGPTGTCVVGTRAKCPRSDHRDTTSQRLAALTKARMRPATRGWLIQPAQMLHLRLSSWLIIRSVSQVRSMHAFRGWEHRGSALAPAHKPPCPRVAAVIVLCPVNMVSGIRTKMNDDGPRATPVGAACPSASLGSHAQRLTIPPLRNQGLGSGACTRLLGARAAKRVAAVWQASDVPKARGSA